MTHHHCTLFIMLASFLAASGVTVPYPPEVQALLHTLETAVITHRKPMHTHLMDDSTVYRQHAFFA